MDKDEQRRQETIERLISKFRSMTKEQLTHAVQLAVALGALKEERG